MKNRDRFVGLRPQGEKVYPPSADGERPANRALYQRDQGGGPSAARTGSKPRKLIGRGGIRERAALLRRLRLALWHDPGPLQDFKNPPGVSRQKKPTHENQLRQKTNALVPRRAQRSRLVQVSADGHKVDALW